MSPLRHTPMAPHQWAVAPAARSAWLLAAVVDACATALVVIDQTATICFANHTYAALRGSDVADLIGRSAFELLPAEIALAAALDHSVRHGSPRSLTVPDQICTDAYGTRRRIAWTVRHLADLDHPDGPDGLVLASGIDVTRERTAEALWRHRAHTDPLTHLPNRASALAALATYVNPEQGAGCATLFCDLDRFKLVNDTHGHAVGDQVLACVAQRMRDLLRDEDLVARLGGDEFLILIPAAGDYAARAIAARLDRAIARPIATQAGLLTIGVSIGICIADAGNDADTVLHQADLAMYKTKTQRRHRPAQQHTPTKHDPRALRDHTPAPVLAKDLPARPEKLGQSPPASA